MYKPKPKPEVLRINAKYWKENPDDYQRYLKMLEKRDREIALGIRKKQVSWTQKKKEKK